MWAELLNSRGIVRRETTWGSYGFEDPEMLNAYVTVSKSSSNPGTYMSKPANESNQHTKSYNEALEATLVTNEIQ